WQFLA
ncbi:hypothetical protein D043_3609B, partial [Vibrio parahaemolyticus EKP-021]